MQKVTAAWTHAHYRFTERKVNRLTSLFFVAWFVVFSLFVLSIYTGRAQAAANDTVNFQARLLSNTGSLVSDGFYTVEFRIYNQSSGGSSLWNETQVLTAKNGYLTANLGSVNDFGTSVDWSQEVWLSMNVNADGEMSPRMKITAVPLAFRANQADALVTSGGSLVTAEQLAQLAPGLVQSVNSGNTALRINQTGAGNLLQLQGDGSDVLTVSKAGDLAVAKGITLGASSLATAGTIRWTGVDFEGYDGSQWVSLTAGTGGGTGNSSITFTSSVTNMAATATTQAGLLVFTSGTAVSNSAGTTTGFVAPADGSFRSCTVNNNAAITAGTVSIRWRVNGASVGAAACTMNSTNSRYGASTIDAGVTTFSAGDTINIAFESAGLTPAGSTEYTAYWTVEYGGNGVPSDAFVQGGNTYGATAVLGTSDNYNLSFVTNGLSRMTVDSAGDIAVVNDLIVGTGLTISSGGLTATGNSTISGTLSGLTGLTVLSGGASVNDGLNLNNDGITNAGSITGVGTALSASGGLTISTGSGADLQFDSASDVVVLNDATLRRVAAGTTLLELNDAADTTLSLLNTDGSSVANMLVEGLITADGFSGDASLLTNIDATALVGTIDDARLSANVSLLDVSQTFSERQILSGGLTVGNTSDTVAGTIRWTGSDFEGYDGSQWVSLTSGGGGGGASGVASVIKPSDQTVNNSAALVNDSHLAFAIEASEEWTYRFVIQANSGVTPNLKFAVTAPAGATCDASVVDAEGATTVSNLGCGVSSGMIAGTGTDETYEVIGTVRNGTTAGTVGLQWSQNSADSSDTTVLAGSYLNAIPVIGAAVTPSNAFVQNGNSFGSSAILGTTDTNSLDFITDGLSRLEITATGNTTVYGGLIADSGITVNSATLLNGDVTIGDASGDVLTITASSATLPNGLIMDGGTLAIDAANNRIGINAATPLNTLMINAPQTNDADAEVLIYTNGINKKGLVAQMTAGQVANTFEVQTSDGVARVAVSSSGSLVLGSDVSGSSSAGILVLNDATNANGFTSVLGTSTLTASRTINLPDANGTICLSGSSLCGFVNFALGSAQTDSSNNASIFINKTGASGDILTLQKGGTTVMSLLNSGALLMQSTNTNAFTVKDTGGTEFFNIDTSGGIVRIGAATGDANATLFLLDSSSAGDPTGTNGGEYYNSTSNKFRCFENSTWKDCIYEPAVRSYVDTTSDPAVDANTTNYWDLAAENNNAYPNITPSATTKGVMVVASIETTATGSTDVDITAHIERGIGSVPTCGSGTVVGARMGTFMTNTGAIKSSTTQFVDAPNTTSQVYYVVCSDAATNGTAANITRINVTLQEVKNTN